MDAETLVTGLATKEVRLRESEAAFLAGQPVSRIFFVRSGVVALMRPVRSGAEAIMQIAEAGEWVAESSLFSDRYHCDAVARVQTTLMSVSKVSLLKVLKADPARCFQWTQMLSAQLRALRSTHEIVRIRGAEERLLRWLWLHASKRVVEVRGTWTDVADELALTREVLYRTLSKLRRANVLSVEGRRVTLRDRSPWKSGSGL
jgi:CRP/FNR family transcriptional regulator, dissimilatory nitrate respiration regulator